MDTAVLELIQNRAECLYTMAQVDRVVSEMAQRITEDFRGKNPLVICVMRGGLVFSGQIVPRLDFAMELDYVHATRYQGDLEGGEVNWLVTPHADVADRHVLLLDDIYDHGQTIADICDACLNVGALSTTVAVLVNKKHNRKVNSVHRPAYVGVNVDDLYVYGCGMDYRGYLRNAPGIFAIKPEDIMSVEMQ